MCRGGLWRVRSTTFQVFCALEEEIQFSLHTLVLEPLESHKAQFVTNLTQSDNVRFYWCIAAADFDDDDIEMHDELLHMLVELFVTVRGFAFPSCWVEKYKQTPPKIDTTLKESSKGVIHRS